MHRLQLAAGFLLFGVTTSVRETDQIAGLDDAEDIRRVLAQQERPLRAVKVVKAQGSECLCDDRKLELWYETGGTSFENKRFKGIVGTALATVVAESQDSSPLALALKTVSKLMTSTASSLGQVVVKDGLHALQATLAGLTAGSAMNAVVLSSLSQSVLQLPLALSLYYVESSRAKRLYMAEMTKSLPKHTETCALAFESMINTLSSNLVDAFSTNMTQMGDFFDATGNCNWRPTKSWGLAGKRKWKYDMDDYNMWHDILYRLKSSYKNGYKVCEGCEGGEKCCGAHLLGHEKCIERNCTEVWKHMLTADFEKEYMGFGILNRYRFAHSWLCSQNGQATSAAASAIYLKRFLAMFSCQFDAWSNSEEMRRMKEDFADAVAEIVVKKNLSKRFIAEVMYNCKKAKVGITVPDATDAILRLTVKQ